jgi:hypothetical protein
MNLLIFLPNGLPGPVPVFLGLNFNGNHTIHPDPQIAVTENWVRNNQDLGITDHRAVESFQGLGGRTLAGGVDSLKGLRTGHHVLWRHVIRIMTMDFKNGIHALMDEQRGIGIPGAPSRPGPGDCPGPWTTSRRMRTLTSSEWLSWAIPGWERPLSGPAPRMSVLPWSFPTTRDAGGRPCPGGPGGNSEPHQSVLSALVCRQVQGLQRP